MANAEPVERALAELGLGKAAGRLLALCPGAEYGPAKRWPVEYFAKVATQKLEEGWEIWLFGSEKDQSITSEIMALTNHRCLDLSGKTSLVEAVDLISICDIFITKDS